jgi:hypothetical protein
VRNTLVTGILLASLLATLAPAGAAAAGNNDRPRQPRELKRTGDDFAVAGTFTGTLDGSVTVGGRTVLITEKTTVFEAGTGAAKRRVRLTDAPVYITGKMRRGVLVASVVVITGGKSPGRSTPLTREFTKPREGKVAQ